MIPFNRPYYPDEAMANLQVCLRSGHASGNGPFSRKCETFLQSYFGFPKALLTTSCTDALEMAAILCQIAPGDEVILPSFTFVSTANAFALRGARLRFVDSQARHPNMDAEAVAQLVNAKTRAIVVVHYAGVACDMDPMLELAHGAGIQLVEDAAQGICAQYKGRPLGSMGALAAFSFHETKNIQCGEGGFLAVNDPGLIPRAEVIREKGTNRAAFFRGEVDKYSWVDLGSSFLPSDILAAVLMAQLEIMAQTQARRMAQWERYRAGLEALAREGLALLPELPAYASHNAHIFYLVLRSTKIRAALMAALKAQGIMAVFHYQSLHRSRFFEMAHDGRELPNSDRFSDCLLRLPLFQELTDPEMDRIIGAVRHFFGLPGLPGGRDEELSGLPGPL